MDGVGGGGGDATAENQATIIAHLTDVKGATWSDETLVAIEAAIEGVGGGTGSNAVTIHIQEADETDISDVTVEVWNSDSSVFVASDTSDAEGDTAFQLDDGSYQVRCRKAGVSFTVPEDVAVSGAGTHDITGTSIEIGTPAAATACRVYEYCFLADGATACTTCAATARIVALPYDSGSMLHAGSSVTGTYDSDTGLLYWDLVQGSTVRIECSTLLEKPKIITVPASDTARLADIE